MEQTNKDQETIRSLQNELQRTRAQLRLQQKAQKVNARASQARDSSKEMEGRNQVKSGRSDGGGSGSSRPCSCSRCRSQSRENKVPRQEELPSRAVDERNPYLVYPSPGFSVRPSGPVLSPPPLPGKPISSLPAAPPPVAARATPPVAAAPVRQNFSSSRGTYSSSGSTSCTSTDSVPYQQPQSDSFTVVNGSPQSNTGSTGKQHMSAVQNTWKGAGIWESSPSPIPPSSHSPAGGNGGTFSHSPSHGGPPRQPLSFSQNPVSNMPPPSATMVNAIPAGAANASRPTSLPKSTFPPVPSSSYQPSTVPPSAPAKMPPFPPMASREPQRSPAEPVYQTPSSAAVGASSYGQYDSRNMRHLPHRYRESPPSTTALRQSPQSQSTPAPPSSQGYTTSQPQTTARKVVVSSPSRSTSASSCDSSISSSSPSSVWSTLAPSSASHRDSHEIIASMTPPLPPGAAVPSHFLSASSTSVPNGNPEALARWQARQTELASTPPSGRQESKPSSNQSMPQESHASAGGGKAMPRVAIHSPVLSPSHPVTRTPGVPTNSSTVLPAGYARSPSQLCSACQAQHRHPHQGRHHQSHNASTCSCRRAELPTSSGPLHQGGAVAVRGEEKEEKFVSQRSFSLPLSYSTHEKRVLPPSGNYATDYASSSANRYTGHHPSHPTDCSGQTPLVSSPYASNDNLRVGGSGRNETRPKSSSHRHSYCRAGHHHRSPSVNRCSCHHHHDCVHASVHPHHHHYHPCSDSYTSTTSEENSVCVDESIERREVSGTTFYSFPSSPSAVPSLISLSEEPNLLPSQPNFSSQTVFRFPSPKKAFPVASFPPPPPPSTFLPPIAASAGVQNGNSPSNSRLSHSFAASMVDQAHQQHLRNAKRALALAHEELGQAREKRMQLAAQVQELE